MRDYTSVHWAQRLQSQKAHTRFFLRSREHREPVREPQLLRSTDRALGGASKSGE